MVTKKIILSKEEVGKTIKLLKSINKNSTSVYQIETSKKIIKILEKKMEEKNGH